MIIFLLESVLEKLVQVCSSVAGVVYKFSNQKIVSFHDNFKFMGNLPLTVYFDFETTTGDSVINDKKTVFYHLLTNTCVQTIAKSSKNWSI